MSDFLAADQAVHATPLACLVDVTPPTFAGIASLVAQSNGSLVASWLAGSDATAPLSYEVYIQAGSATDLFAPSNLLAITQNLSFRIFSIASGSPLEALGTYFVGVRAKDAVGNVETNVVSLSAQSAGVPDNSVYNLIAQLARNSCAEFDAVAVEEEINAVSEDSELEAQLVCED